MTAGGGEHMRDVVDVDRRLVVAPVSIVGGATAAAVVGAKDTPLARMPLGEVGEIRAVAGEPAETKQRRSRRYGIAVIAIVELEPVLARHPAFAEGDCGLADCRDAAVDRERLEPLSHGGRAQRR